MEFLHVIPARTGDILEFLRCMEKRPDSNEHKYLALVGRDTAISYVPELLAFPRMEYLETPAGEYSAQRKMRALKKRLKQADVIIWHTLTMFGGDFIPLLSRNPDLCAKSVWIENGIDAESWPSREDSWENALFRRQNRKVRAAIPIVGVPLEADQAYIRSLWPNKRVMTLPYPIRKEYVEAADEVLAMERQDFSELFSEMKEQEEEVDFFRWTGVKSRARMEEEAQKAAEEAAAAEQAAQAAQLAAVQEAVAAMQTAQGAKPEVSAAMQAAQLAVQEAVAAMQTAPGAASEAAPAEDAEAAAAQKGPAEGPDTAEEKEPSRLPRIQIGLSSSLANGHAQLFTAMQAYKGIPQQIYVPMNLTLEKQTCEQGTKKYKQSIETDGRSRWRARFHPMDRKYSKEAYFNYLFQIDAALLGNRTSICAQYLLLMLRSGRKLYLKDDSYVYQWLKKCGVPVHSIKEIENMTYQEFLAPDDMKELPEQLALYYDPAAIMEAWSVLFSELKAQRGNK